MDTHVYELYVLSYNILLGNGISFSCFLVIRWSTSFWLTEIFHQWLHIDQFQRLARWFRVGIYCGRILLVSPDRWLSFPWLAFARIRFFLAAWLIKSPSSHAPTSNKMQTFSKVQHWQATHMSEALYFAQGLYFQCRCKSILYMNYIIVIYYLIYTIIFN